MMPIIKCAECGCVMHVQIVVESFGCDEPSTGGRPPDRAINDAIVRCFDGMKERCQASGHRFRQMDAAETCLLVLPEIYRQQGQEPKEHSAESIIRRYRRLKANG